MSKSNVGSGKPNPALNGKPTGQTTLAKLKDPLKCTSENPTAEKSFDQVTRNILAFTIRIKRTV